MMASEPRYTIKVPQDESLSRYQPDKRGHEVNYLIAAQINEQRYAVTSWSRGRPAKSHLSSMCQHI